MKGEKSISLVHIGRPGLVAANFVTLNHLLQDKRVQIHRITVLKDLSSLRFQIFKQTINIPFTRQFVELHQNVILISMREVCLVNLPPMLSWFLQFIFMSIVKQQIEIASMIVWKLSGS